MNFTKQTVSWGPFGSPRTTEALVSQVSSTLMRLMVTAGPIKGDILYASFSSPGWPTGPDTSGMSIAIQHDGEHEAPPDNTADALGNPAFDVFVMHKCNSWKEQCNFKPAFDNQILAPLPLVDKCQVHADCTSCIDDPSNVCGWCDGIITHSDGTTCGNDGKGCCGGATSFSKCNITYRKVCPVMCDWTNWKNPVCRPATSGEINNPKIAKYDDCDVVKKYRACEYDPADTYYYCDVGRGCQGPLNKEKCIAEPKCNVSRPTCNQSECHAPHIYYCDETGVRQCRGPLDMPRCKLTPGCDINKPSCDPNVCKPQEVYTCDDGSGQCLARVGPAPPNVTSYNTSNACKLACAKKPVEGVWRAISINKGFVVDEWDFNFGSAASGSHVTYHSKKTGDTFTGTYAIGARIDTSVEQFGAFDITITLKTGGVFKGLFNNQWTGPITKFMFLGLPTKNGDKIDSFHQSMESLEFVLISCLPHVKNCDFSRANPDSLDMLELLV